METQSIRTLSGATRTSWNKGMRKPLPHCIDCNKEMNRGARRKRATGRCQKCFGIFRGKSKRGIKFTLETKERMSLAKKGIRPKNLGVTFGLKGKNNNKWKGGITKNLKEYHKNYAKKYLETHREQIYFYIRQRETLKRNAEGKHTLQEWRDLKVKYNFTCPCCLKKEPEIILTEDHIIPITKNGSNYISNIQPLCRSCNTKKSNRIIIKYEFNYA